MFSNCSKKVCNITFNEKKCTYATDSQVGLPHFERRVAAGPDRVKPLLELPVPNTGKELQRIVGNVCVLRSVGPLFFRKKLRR